MKKKKPLPKRKKRIQLYFSRFAAYMFAETIVCTFGLRSADEDLHDLTTNELIFLRVLCVESLGEENENQNPII